MCLLTYPTALIFASVTTKYFYLLKRLSTNEFADCCIVIEIVYVNLTKT